MEADPLDLFLPPVKEWFRRTLGEPTPPQRQGWPVIAAGQNALILSPTGSGKTLAAFLACLDHLWRQPQLGHGVKVLYVSPLKALNNDIQRNLQEPLEGVATTARAMGFPLPVLASAVRTGDTPVSERARQLRRPPHILITTPESLHLLLTSRGREMLGGVTHCIIDEIHGVCGNKRGVFLSLLLERLEALASGGRNPPVAKVTGGLHPPLTGSFVRIGLSATQRPLEEVARFLGGPRPVTIVDAGQRKELDLKVVSPVAQFGPLPEKSIWPSIYQYLRDEIQQHRSTLVFANDRRGVERITAFLNENEELARAHHGSVSLEMRRQTEQSLKEGRLRCVVTTASLEMGIDMGAVDLVCQVASPGTVSRGLQRVGRAGHLVGQKSKGRLVPRTPMDLLEQAVLAHEMAAGRVEELRVPLCCLDVLAQQIVAMVAMESWSVPELLAVVRQAYPYRDLSPAAFESVLVMISGRLSAERRAQSAEREETGALRSTLCAPRISWDRVHNRLLALPGSQQVALVNGGTIPDTGQFAAVTPTGLRIGELDEEFVYERRVGDAFVLGTNTWRVNRIDSDRVEVVPAEGAHAVLPFWRGEGAGRSSGLGLAVGRFLRELRERITEPGCLQWLEQDYFLEPAAARNLLHHVRRQLDGGGALPTDRCLAVETSRDQLGDWQVILLSPFGGRLHLTLRLALEGRLNQRLGYRPQCLHHDDGLLVRLTESDEPLLDLLDGLTPENVEDMILDELGDSALFALRFRQNAARSLMLPRTKTGQRAPLWLQRLRGRDLLQAARQQRDFPVVVETFRECLHDHLDVPRLQQLLRDLREGRLTIEAKRRELPSPFAANIVFAFTAANLYRGDDVEPAREKTAELDRDLLGQMLASANPQQLLNARAIHQVERRLRGVGRPPRSVAEMAEWLRRLGDLTEAELEGPMANFLGELEADDRVCRLELPRTPTPLRWVLTEEQDLYQRAFGLTKQPAEQEAGAAVLVRFLQTHALVSLADILDRYPFEPAWAERQLRQWAESGRVVSVPPLADVESVRFSTPENLEQVQRSSLGMLRREIITCSAPQLVDFVLRWQGAHPDTRRGGADCLADVLARLGGLALPAMLWEEAVLPARVPQYQGRWLDEWISGGNGAWFARGDPEDGGAVCFLDREELLEVTPLENSSDTPLSPEEQRILDLLRQRGALFVVDLAQASGLSPSEVRAAIWKLAARSLVTNDHFDVVRRGRPEGAGAAREQRKPLLRVSRSSPRRDFRGSEGRWSLVPWANVPSPETQAILMAGRLLQRYGIAARELALMDAWMPPWRVLYEVLSRMELSGEVRRGYFAEGLSGAQFALPEAVRLLQELHLPSTATAPVILLASQDPANLYGSGAPLDVPLLDGGTRSFTRRGGNWISLRAGRPVLLIEQQGKKLTALPTASREDVAAAAACLPSLCQANGNVRARLTVEEWNGQPVTATEGRELLESAGFVRDYQSMTLYAIWR